MLVSGCYKFLPLADFTDLLIEVQAFKSLAINDRLRASFVLVPMPVQSSEAFDRSLDDGVSRFGGRQCDRAGGPVVVT
jgi:hypothetical protein